MISYMLETSVSIHLLLNNQWVVRLKTVVKDSVKWKFGLYKLMVQLIH